MKVVRTLSIVCLFALAAGSAAAQEPIRVGGQITAPVKIKDVAPVMPAIAATAGVRGVVILEATIGTDGTVTEAKVLRNVALLDQAAIDAVMQWVYKPTILNGVPVPVIMTVTVNFPPAEVKEASPEPATADAKPLRVGGDIKAPRKLVDVPPLYPPEALAAGISGIVIIEATIGTDGKVTDASVLRSVAGLDDAALTAVRQWEFQRTTLNGVPVPIIMTVTVNFVKG